ncbi:hypothetical protein R1flu_016605 [Riccia fluitans]|uniref:Uncharacterized protein n=1 Tax=Riccia fluitans TaxID=41844 RepID=A0ABD1YNB8_9MARC
MLDRLDKGTEIPDESPMATDVKYGWTGRFFHEVIVILRCAASFVDQRETDKLHRSRGGSRASQWLRDRVQAYPALERITSVVSQPYDSELTLDATAKAAAFSRYPSRTAAFGSLRGAGERRPSELALLDSRQGPWTIAKRSHSGGGARWWPAPAVLNSSEGGSPSCQLVKGSASGRSSTGGCMGSLAPGFRSQPFSILSLCTA